MTVERYKTVRAMAEILGILKVDLLLFGSSRLSNEQNVEIFSHVQQFIKESKCFCLFFFNLNLLHIYL